VFILLALSIIIYAILAAAVFIDWEEGTVTPTVGEDQTVPEATVTPILPSPTYTLLPASVPSLTRTATTQMTATSTSSPGFTPVVTITVTVNLSSAGEKSPTPNYLKTVSAVSTKIP
jgi:hypothetical protein